MTSEQLNPDQFTDWERKVLADPTSTRFWHVTDREFKPGDELLPPAQTGYQSRWTHPHYSPEHVYLQTEGYAANSAHFGRHVYEVEPHGPVGLDPERQPGEDWDYPEEDPAYGSFTATKATVKKRVLSKPEGSKDLWVQDEVW